MLKQAILSTALLLSGPTHAEVISGLAKVTDGDTIRINSERIRLHGIDAPELQQQCSTETGKLYQCGQSAAAKLREIIGNQPVDCQIVERDIYNRIVGICFNASGKNLQSWLVESGWAVAYRRYSTRYVEEETVARKARRGIWRGSFTMPQIWRRQNRK